MPQLRLFLHKSKSRLFLGLLIVFMLLLGSYLTIRSQESNGNWYQVSNENWYQVQAMEAADLGVANPVGLAYSPETNLLFSLSVSANGSVTDVTRFNLLGDTLGTNTLVTDVPDPLNVAYYAPTAGLFFFDTRGSKPELVQLEIGPGGEQRPASQSTIRSNALAYGVRRAQGITFDVAQQRLFVLDIGGTNPTLIHITAGPNNSFDGDAAEREGRLRRTPLPALRDITLRGIAFNPQNDHLYILSPDEQMIYELTTDGEIVSTLDVAELNLTNPQSMVFAPSADSTDDPANMDLFLLDSGVMSETGNGGQIFELSFQTAAAPTALEVTSLVQIIDTSKAAWNPSSPDPSGIAYRPAIGLLISDGEVEEDHPDFQGFNVFESTTAGSLFANCATTAFSNEPIGVAVNPTNGHIFFSDDNANAVFEVDLVNGIYCDGDDIVSSLSTSPFGSGDPEGLAYGDNKLFISDGVNREVYVIDLGTDGVIGGSGAAADVLVYQFDTETLGLRDPEGIEYSAARNSLFIVSTTRGDDFVVETDPFGTVLFSYDLSFLGSIPRSGLAYGPGSQNPSISTIYMASRGVDNGADPNENDGKVYEIALNSTGLTADFNGDQTSGFTPLTVNFTDLSIGNPTSWSWDFGDGGTSTAQDPSHTYTAVGTYDVMLTVSNLDGMDTETKAAYITVTDLPPVPTADFSGTPLTGSAPLTVNFTDLSTGSPSSWSWNFGDGIGTSTLQNPSYAYTTPGTYDVTLTVSNVSGNDTITKVDYIAVTAFVNDPPVAVDDSASTTTHTAVIVDAVDNDTDVDGNLDPTSAIVTSGPFNGTVINNGDGTFTYTPDTGFESIDSFDYEVCDTGTDLDGSTDGDDLCDTATVTITVNATPPGAAYRSHSTAATEDAAQLTILKPAGVFSGDVLVAFLMSSNNTAMTWTPPAGWNMIGPQYSTGSYDATAWYKVAGSEPNDYTWSVSTANEIVGAIFAVSGADTANPIAAQQRDGNSLPNTLQVTTAVDDALLILWGAQDAVTSQTWTNPDGMTEHYDVTQTATFLTHAGYTGDSGLAGTYARTVDGSAGGSPLGWLVAIAPSFGTPVADFSGSPTTGDASLTVDFTDLSGGGPTSWSWDFGDTNTSTLQNPSHTYTTPGTYTVALTVSNSSGSDTMTKVDYITVTVPPPPPVAEFSGSPTTGDASLTVDFTDLSGGGPTSWSWDFGDTNTSTLQNPSHTYTTPGTYTVALTVSNSSGSDTMTKVNYITVTVPPPPAADFSGSPTTGDASLTVDFTDLSGGGPTSWSWDFGDTNTSTLQNPSHTYATPGTYTVALTVSNSGGSDTMTKVDYITVTVPPPPVAEFSGSPTTGDASLTVDFTDLSGGGATSWSWDFGDTNTSTLQNPSHTYTTPGTYTVALTVSNSGGSDTMTKVAYITVNEPPPTALYVSLASNQIVGGVNAADEDILWFDGSTWSLFFDGSDVGIRGDLNAFYIIDANNVLMSFSQQNVLNGVTIDEHDIALFTGTLGDTTSGTFSLYFDGDAHDLTSPSEDIDAIHLLSDGRLIISTVGTPSLPGVTDPKDEDLFVFDPATNTWAMYFDASDVGISGGSDVNAVSIAANGDIYLSTDNTVVVENTLTAEDEDVLVCTPGLLGESSTCTAVTLFFDGSLWALETNDLDGIHLP